MVVCRGDQPRHFLKFVHLIQHMDNLQCDPTTRYHAKIYIDRFLTTENSVATQ